MKANGTGVLVTEAADDNIGFCFDYFNPNLPQIISKQIFNSFNSVNRGLWLQDNAPYFDTNNISTNYNVSNPFYSIPYFPGMNGNTNHFNDLNSLPFNAIEVIGFNGTDPILEYHYNLHGLYGTQMAKVVMNST